MLIAIGNNQFLVLYEVLADTVITKEYPEKKLPSKVGKYSARMWKYNHEIKVRMLKIFSERTNDAAYFQRILERFKKDETKTIGVDRLALLGALTYIFEHTDQEILQRMANIFVEGKRAEFAWKEFCTKYNDKILQLGIPV